ncbi:glucosaminidase domain-containing protein [Epidermidibacterium keratini]
MVSRKTAMRRRRTLAIAAAIVTFSTIGFVSCDTESPADIPTAKEEFIAYAAEAAQDSQDEYGVPPSVAMAQAILESDWGSSKLTREGFAFFGIKCNGQSPHASGCTELPTTECDDAGCQKVLASFRTYDSPEDSFADYGYLLSSTSRYKAAFDHTGDPKLFAVAVANAGYATDPEYSSKVIGLMDEYNLYQYDE